MKTVRDVKITPYDPSDYGLLRGRRRLARVRFRDNAPPREPDKAWRGLLEEVYARMARDPLVPILPERIRAEWRPAERAFVLHGAGLAGFEVEVRVVNRRDRDEIAAGPESSAAGVAALHGSALPGWA